MKAELVRPQKGAESVHELRNELKGEFRKNKTWNTPNFFIYDIDLCNKFMPDYTKSNIYTTIRYLSLKAEDLVCDLIQRYGYDYDTAKKMVKDEYTMTILCKIKRLGWREPNEKDLDDDQSKRLQKAKAGYRFAKRRSKRIKQVILKEEVVEE